MAQLIKVVLLYQLLLLCRPLLGAPAVFTVTTDADAGPGSLREAIALANANPGPDRIEFSLPGPGVHTITLVSDLDVLLDPVVIDGYTQPGASTNTLATADNAVLCIQLVRWGKAAIGVQVSSSNCLVRGLSILGFGRAIGITGGGFNEVSGNFIGVAASGDVQANCAGIEIANSVFNLIGGPTPAQRNVISGNSCVEFSENGIYITGRGASNNIVMGNFVGLMPNGTSALGNRPHGIKIDNASFNLVGGIRPEHRNYISGNLSDGIQINDSGAWGNVIAGNFIGTDAAGTLRLANATGVEITSASGNTIGPKNLISGNTADGVRINATNNAIWGNYIGTVANGLAALPNGGEGVYITGTSNTVGGIMPGSTNLISGNQQNGVLIGSGTANWIAGNLIGTDVTGSNALGNAWDGVRVKSAANTIGALNGVGGNIISGNTNAGVNITGASGNVVEGNFIGTDLTGHALLGNGSYGVSLSNAANSRVGGTLTAAGNLISGNLWHGLALFSSTNTMVQANWIGTDLGLNTTLGNAGSGVFIDEFTTGTVINSANVIGGNAGNGILLRGAFTTLEGNFIGTDYTGTTPLGNCSSGVSLSAGAHDNTIGSRLAGAGNLIAYNGAFCGLPLPPGVGVVLAGDTTLNNSIRGNSIFANRDLGIDLSPLGVSPNDYRDGDNGPNHLQNFPTLLSATNGGGGAGVLRIDGRFNSIPNTRFFVDFYANTECDPSGYGEGERFLISGFLDTDSNGDSSGSPFVFLFYTNVPSRFRYLTATATDPDNNTSEFSPCIPVIFNNHPPVPLCGDVTVRLTNGCDAYVTFTGSDPDGDPITIIQDPPPPYPLGTTVVTVTAIDDKGASNSCTATVTVIDVKPPDLTCPPNITQAHDAGVCAAVVSYPNPTATDNCPGPINLFCAPPSGSTFPVGVTTVHCYGTDTAGNAGTCSFTVKVLSDALCPELKIISVVKTAGSLILTVETPYPALPCTILESLALDSAQWMNVPNVQFTPPNGNRLQAIFVPDGSPRFYRVVTSMPQQ